MLSPLGMHVKYRCQHSEDPHPLGLACCRSHWAPWQPDSPGGASGWVCSRFPRYLHIKLNFNVKMSAVNSIESAFVMGKKNLYCQALAPKP